MKKPMKMKKAAPAKMGHKKSAAKMGHKSPAKKKKLTDLSGDGKVTKKDVLIGRGVISATKMKKAAMKLKKDSMAMLKKSAMEMKKASAMKMKMKKSMAKMKKASMAKMGHKKK